MGAGFDISGEALVSDLEYSTLSPFRWPLTPGRQGGRFFGDGLFFTPNGKAWMLALTPRDLDAKLSAEHPFRLNTGRVRDQWHTMTRTAKSPRLSAHLAEPFLEIHPGDAARIGISAAGLVQVQNATGTAILRALITDPVGKRQVFAPMHWTGETASSAVIDALMPGVVDPVSGQPESKGAAVALALFQADWYDFAVSTKEIKTNSAYWAKVRTSTGWRADMAGIGQPEDWEADTRTLFDLPSAAVQSMQDVHSGVFRAAFYDGGKLLAALFVSPRPVAVVRDYLVEQPGKSGPSVLARLSPADQPDPGPTVCSCFGVGLKTILAAIARQRLTSVAQIGQALQAGTNCGSCRPELSGIRASFKLSEAAG
jgi:assimilatory nitrate reductase catalytic subunit